MTDSRPIVLIVDDKPTNLSVLAEYLAERYRVLTAESGERALEALPLAKPDIILLDVMMPGLNGFDTCRAIKQDKHFSATPVIFLTALDDAEDKVQGFQCGGVDYIAKPLHQEEVLARVETQLTMRRLQADLEEKVRALDQSVRERDSLIEDLNAYARTVAHDLKNPVSVLCGMADTMGMSLDRLDKEGIARRLKTISSSAWKLQSIIDDLLFFAGVARESVRREKIEIAPIVQQAMERMQNLIDTSEAKIIVEDDLPDAMGHAQWVEEVFYNYLSNAVKYGGAPPEIRVSAQVEPLEGRIVYAVIDNGEGMRESEIAALFQPYTQGKNRSNDSHGLGLSIVKRIVQKLGGESWAASEVGKGSTFYFSLAMPESSAQPPRGNG